jgi:hypothetical protein
MILNAIAKVIVANQPKPIPINFEEATHIAKALLEHFEIEERNVRN